jgi:photosystem II stability/assembly factor-like uncharacterized protein
MTSLLIGTGDGVFRLEGTAVEREGTVPAVRFLAAGDRCLYALTGDNALWRRDGNWSLINPRCIDDEPWTLASDPRLPGRLYIGVSPALVHRSDDGGTTWAACDSIRRIPGYDTWTFPPPPHIPHVRSIAPDPERVGGVYIGVEEGGIFRSPDGGDSWESLNEGLYWDVHTVTPTPGGDRLYATTGGGFYRSDDSGRQWRHVKGGIDRGYTVTFAAAPGATDRLFVAAAATPPPGWRNGANAALYRSADGGESWTRLSKGLPAQFDRMVGALAVNGNDVYAASGSSLFASTDGGESWRVAAEDLPPVQALALA